ncbi:MAG: hypothetical protein AAB899_03740 [Patescibacteria group bacterium]
MGIDEMKSGNEETACEVAVGAALSLRPASPQETTDAAIGEMVRAIVEAGLTFGEQEVIFAKLDEKASLLARKLDLKNRRNQLAKYLVQEIRDAVVALRKHSNAARQREQENHLAKYGL